MKSQKQGLGMTFNRRQPGSVSATDLGKAQYLWVCVLALSLLTSVAWAEKLYKYRDANGVLHYSNIHPDTDQPMEIEQVRVRGVESHLSVKVVKTETAHTLVATNDYGGPVEVEFTIPEGKNIVTRPMVPKRIVVAARQRMNAIRISPIRKDQSWSYRYTYRYCFGDPTAQHHPPKPYRPPFQSGHAFHISQAFGGSYSHNTAQSKYAIDIVMPEGTRICAARGGIVMDIANDFYTGGTNLKENISRANYMRILHNDGTMAIYAHLKLETIRIGIGQKVSAGEVIAESGNTGFSSGPHLHFAIQKNMNLRLVSIPFKIMSADGDSVTPTRNEILTVY